MKAIVALLAILMLASSCKTRSVYQSSLKQENAKKIRHSIIDLPFKNSVGFTIDPLSRLAFLTSTSGETALIDLDRGTALWQTGSNKEEFAVYGEFSPSGALLAVNSSPGKITIIEPKTGHEVSNLKPPCVDQSAAHIFYSKMVWSNDQRLLAAAVAAKGVLPERKRFINIWDTQTGDCILAVPAVGNIVSLRFSGDSRHLYSFSQDTHFSIYDLTRRTFTTVTVDELKYPHDSHGAFFGGKVSFRDDGRLATVAWNRSIGEAGNPQNPFRSMPMVIGIDLEARKKIWQREWTPSREERFFQVKTVEFDPSGNRLGVYVHPGRWFVINSINGDILEVFESGDEPEQFDSSLDSSIPNLFFSKKLDKFFGPIGREKLPVWSIN